MNLRERFCLESVEETLSCQETLTFMDYEYLAYIFKFFYDDYGMLIMLLVIHFRIDRMNPITISFLFFCES